VGVVGHQGQVDDRGDQVAYGISLLKKAGNETASVWRYVFERGGCSETLHDGKVVGGHQSNSVLRQDWSSTYPNSAHGNTEQGPDRQELLIRVAKGRSQFENRDEQEVDHQRPFSSVTIRCDPEQHGAHRTEEKRECDGGGDVGSVPSELRRKSSGSETDGKVLREIRRFRLSRACNQDSSSPGTHIISIHRPRQPS
jgi:hypothetical protein